MPDLFLQLHEDDAALDAAPPLSETEALALLERAEFTAAKLIPWGSNYTFGVALECQGGREQLAIYKPRAGEAPLYDFPDGSLYKRELAAYLVSRRLGWDLVPPTVIREGPNGVGSVQLYVEPAGDEADPQRFWGRCDPAIERMVLFDHVTNNADRKIGHCLRDARGKVWGIDHGLTFHRQPKLRTVLWQYVGQPVAPELLNDLRRLDAERPAVEAELAPLLERGEIGAFLGRVGTFLRNGVYPILHGRRNVPWGWW